MVAVRFDMQRFRHDVKDWINWQPFGGRAKLTRESGVAPVTISRLLDDPGKLSDIHAIVKIAVTCKLNISDYVAPRIKDYIRI